MSLEGRNNFRSFIYSHSSTKPENSVKIGSVDVETIGLAEIVRTKKNKQETQAEHRPAFGCVSCSPSGRADNITDNRCSNLKKLGPGVSLEDADG